MASSFWRLYLDGVADDSLPQRRTQARGPSGTGSIHQALHPALRKALMILAEIDARLGRKAEAIRESENASKLLPVSNDAFDGPDILARLAGVLAQAGETRRALDLLEQVTKMPGAPSLTRPCYGRLKLEEVWDPLRDDPRFEKILASLAPKDAKQ